MKSPQPATAIPEAPVLSDRAKRRLRIAASLLRAQGMSFDVSRDHFYPHLLGIIKTFPEQRRLHLSALVDWVEEYEATEHREASTRGKPPGAAGAVNRHTPPSRQPATNSTAYCSKLIEQGNALQAPAGPGRQPTSQA